MQHLQHFASFPPTAEIDSISVQLTGVFTEQNLERRVQMGFADNRKLLGFQCVVIPLQSEPKPAIASDRLWKPQELRWKAKRNLSPLQNADWDVDRTIDEPFMICRFTCVDVAGVDYRHRQGRCKMSLPIAQEGLHAFFNRSNHHLVVGVRRKAMIYERGRHCVKAWKRYVSAHLRAVPSFQGNRTRHSFRCRLF
jgi:hypothetical protein